MTTEREYRGIEYAVNDYGYVTVIGQKIRGDNYFFNEGAFKCAVDLMYKREEE